MINQITQTEIYRLVQSGMMTRGKPSPAEPSRKPHTYKVSTLAAMAAKKLPAQELHRRELARKRKRGAANLAAGLTYQGKPRKRKPAIHRNAIGVLSAGLLAYITYLDQVNKTGLYTAAKRMGVKVKFKDGICTLDKQQTKVHTTQNL